MSLRRVSKYVRWFALLRRVFQRTFHDLRSNLRMTASSADSMGHGGTRSPTVTTGCARGTPWAQEKQTRNWPNCTDCHESAHQNDWLYFRSQKSRGARQNKCFLHFAPDRCPPLSNSIRRHCWQLTALWVNWIIQAGQLSLSSLAVGKWVVIHVSAWITGWRPLKRQAAYGCMAAGQSPCVLAWAAS